MLEAAANLRWAIAHLDRLSAQVRPVQLQQIKGVQKPVRLVAAMPEQLRGWEAGFDEARPVGGQAINMQLI
jgi:hypothetical protein